MAVRTRESRYTQHLRITNRRDQAIKLWIEPWGDVVSIEPDGTCEIVAKGPRGDCLEVTSHEKDIMVWGWTGSTIAAFREGKIVLEYTIPVPKVPSRRSFQRPPSGTPPA